MAFLLSAYYVTVFDPSYFSNSTSSFSYIYIYMCAPLSSHSALKSSLSPSFSSRTTQKRQNQQWLLQHFLRFPFSSFFSIFAFRPHLPTMEEAGKVAMLLSMVEEMLLVQWVCFFNRFFFHLCINFLVTEK